MKVHVLAKGGVAVDVGEVVGLADAVGLAVGEALVVAVGEGEGVGVGVVLPLARRRLNNTVNSVPCPLVFV